EIEQRRLAGAVRTDDQPALPRLDREVHARGHAQAAERLVEMTNGQRAHVFAGSRDLTSGEASIVAGRVGVNRWTLRETETTHGPRSTGRKCVVTATRLRAAPQGPAMASERWS